MDHAGWVKDGLVFLLAAGVVVPIFHHFRLGTVLGFIVAGVVVGPFGLGRFQFEFPVVEYLVIQDPERVEPFAELGVIFLLFVLGLEMSFAKLWDLRCYVLGVGTSQVALSAAGIGLAAYVFGEGAGAAFVIGLTLALSSTAIVMQLLVEQRRLATPPGRISLSVLLMQDLMVIPILVVVGLLAGEAEHDSVANALLVAFAKAVAAVAVILLAGRFVLAPLLRHAALTGIRELIMAIVLVAVVAASVSTEVAGLSPELGAFLAGVLIAESEYRQQVEVDIDPFKGLLLGLFFTTVGMGIDPLLVASQFGWIALTVVALLAFKATVLFIACRAFGVGRAHAAESAIVLAQAGEFGFVVLALAGEGGVVPPAQAQFLVVVVSLSMMATPFLAPLGRAAAARLERTAASGAAPDGAEELSDHVVIGGFGRVGQMIARALEAENVPFVALDRNARLVGEQRALGRKVFFGDAGRPELLERAGAERARAFVSTVDSTEHARQMVRAVRRHQPDVPVYARARDPADAVELRRLGAVGVVPEAVEGSLQLAAHVLDGLDFPDEVVIRRVTAERERERRILDDAAEEAQAAAD